MLHVDQFTMCVEPKHSVSHTWYFLRFQGTTGQQVTVALQCCLHVLAVRVEHGVTVTIATDILPILFAFDVLLVAVVVGDRVGAYGGKTIKLTRHFTDMYLLHLKVSKLYAFGNKASFIPNRTLCHVYDVVTIVPFFSVLCDT